MTFEGQSWSEVSEVEMNENATIDLICTMCLDRRTTSAHKIGAGCQCAV